jgi:hypothetical protein
VYFDQLAHSQFAGSAQFGLTIDPHLTLGDHDFGHTATAGQTGGFEQGVERDVLTTQLKFKDVHKKILFLKTQSIDCDHIWQNSVATHHFRGVYFGHRYTQESVCE